MRNNLKWFVFIMFLLQHLPPLCAAISDLSFPDPDTTISMDFQDASLKSILKILSIQSGLNFIATEAVQERKITLFLDKVPIQEAMEKIFKANNLYYEQDPHSNIFIVKDWGKPQVDTITRIYRLKYQSVSTSSFLKEKATLGSSITSGHGGGGGSSGSSSGSGSLDLVNSIKQVLSENGKISEDARSNSLVITDVPNRFPVIEDVISRLDVAQPQVMLEVEILDVNKSTIDKLGVNWPQTLVQLTVPGSRVTRFPFGGMGTSGDKATLTADAGVFGGPGEGWDFSDGWPANQFGPSILTVIGATLTLDFLRSQSDTKTLARPRILTLNNETAEIKITTDESVNPSQTTSGTSGLTTSTSSVERKETGVSLRVSPQINPDTNEITMFIMPRVADTKAGIDIPTSGGATIHVKDPEECSTKSVVRVKDGDTVVIGGLIRNEFSETLSKVPLLGDMPVVGALFRHKDVDKNRERELLIFITPHIIKEGNVTLAKTDKVNLLEREQDNVSGVDRRTLIETSLNSFDKGR